MPQLPPQHELDSDARRRASALEMAGKLPPRFVEQHYPTARAELVELRRLKAAGAAATDADTYVALARGFPVPASRLNKRIVDAKLRRLTSGR